MIYGFHVEICKESHGAPIHVLPSTAIADEFFHPSVNSIGVNTGHACIQRKIHHVETFYNGFVTYNSEQELVLQDISINAFYSYAGNMDLKGRIHKIVTLWMRGKTAAEREAMRELYEAAFKLQRDMSKLAKVLARETGDNTLSKLVSDNVDISILVLPQYEEVYVNALAGCGGDVSVLKSTLADKRQRQIEQYKGSALSAVPGYSIYQVPGLDPEHNGTVFDVFPG